MNTQQYSVAAERKKIKKLFSLDVILVPAGISLSLLLLTVITGMMESLMSGRARDQAILFCLIFLLCFGGYFGFKLIYKDNKWVKFVSRKIQELKSQHGFNEAKHSRIMSIFRHERDQLLYNQDNQHFFLATYLDSGKDKNHVMVQTFSLKETDRYEVLMDPPELTRYFANHGGKFGLAGALQYGLGGAIIGSIADGLLSDFRSKTIKLMVRVRFYSGNQVLLDYMPIKINMSIIGRDALEQFLTKTMKELHEGCHKLSTILQK